MTETKGQTYPLDDFLQLIAERKVQDVVALNVEGLTSYADTIIIVTAASARQVSSIADHVYTSMKSRGNLALGAEGIKEGRWALLDYGDVIIHVFDRETRTFYDIAGLWSDAPRIDLSEYEFDPDDTDD